MMETVCPFASTHFVDPATPKQWRPYIIKGINDWNAAFEKAGFKNAIIGKEWPEDDTTMSSSLNFMDLARGSTAAICVKYMLCSVLMIL